MLTISRIEDHVATLPYTTAVAALTGYFEALRRSGHTLYFLTLTYKQEGDQPLKLAGISRAFGFTYVELLRRYVHGCNFARPKYQPLQPIVFAFPDQPKSKLKRLGVVPAHKVGLHHHAIVAAVPEVARRLDGSCSRDSLTSLCPRLLTSDLQRIGPTLDDISNVVCYATAYAFKRLPRADEDYRMLVFPHVERWKPATGVKRQLVA